VILGHYAVALAAKKAAPDTSLGTLVLAGQWLDEIWPVFLLLGWERVRIAPGHTAANPLDFVHYPLSHSLLAVLGWGMLLGRAYYAARRYRTGARIVALAVVSHWLLDVPMHQPDLPLWPGSSPVVGGGLWNSIAATVVVELGLFAAGMAIYLRTTRAVDRIGSWGLGAMAALLALIFASGFFSPPPADERSLAISALGLWIFVGLGYWIDRHRAVRAAAEAPAAARETAMVLE
jgi:hypothetical protein